MESKSVCDGVLELALDEGLVDRADIDGAAGDHADDRLQSLVLTGKLTAAWVARASARKLPTTLRLGDEQWPSSGRTISGAITGVVGRYEIGELLGSGGMAEVYRAFDTTLNRNVALKFLRITDDEHLTRFLREARTQAQIGHENICDVFETGTLAARPFISMQYINGLTLGDAAPRMSLEEKVRVMAEVAEALHAAHRTGLVHRDLKPQNIMVERAERGWHPYVLDFGLAKDQSMDTMTTIGVVMGTPPYMAPEQARGERERIDRRTDVYALGATLYDVIAGHPPFVGDSGVATMLMVIGEDAPSLRSVAPSVPQDLDTIVMKCLDKDPQRRYDSARALAEDLRLYLDGEPIRGKPTTVWHRWFIRARKHPTISSLLAIAALIALVSIGWAVTTSIQSRDRQRAAQRFGQEVQRIEGIARYASMLPLHDVTRERLWIRQRIDAIGQAGATMGSMAAGPASYAIGRGYLALSDWEQGRHHLQSAWDQDYRTPELAYAIGLALGTQYQHELDEAERLSSKDARAARRKQVEQQFRQPALEYLRRSTGSGSESSAYVEGLIAFYEERHDEALRQARSAFAQVPWLYEAKKLEGDIWLARGQKDFNTGAYDQAMQHYDRAGEAYAVAESIASSDAGVLLGQAERWFRVMTLRVVRGADPREAMQQGIAAAERAAQTGHQLAASFHFRGALLLRFAEYQTSKGESPVETLNMAVQLAEKAIAADAKSANYHRLMGTLLFNKARYAVTHGEDAIPLFDASIRSLRRASELPPPSAQTLSSLANSLRRKAEALADRGQSPLALLDESIVYYDRSAAADPEWANNHNDRGLAFMTRGEWEMEHGSDPMRSFDETARSLNRALAINPQYAIAYLNLGSTHLDRGNYLQRTGRDPRPVLSQASDSYGRAIKLNPKLAFAHSNNGLASYISAQYALDVMEDPTLWIDRGIQAYEQSLLLNPGHARSLAYRGLLHLTAAQFVARSGGDPRPRLALARASVREANVVNPTNVESLQFAAAIEAEEARYALAHKRSPVAHLTAAGALLRNAIGISAQEAATYQTEADVHRIRAEWLVSQGQNPAEEISRGLQSIDRVLAIDKESGEAYGLRGELLLLRNDHTGATAAFARAIELKPSARKRWEGMAAKRVAGAG